MVKRYLPGTTEVRKERGRKDERKEGRNRKEGYTCINILLVEYRSPAPLLSSLLPPSLPPLLPQYTVWSYTQFVLIYSSAAAFLLLFAFVAAASIRLWRQACIGMNMGTLAMVRSGMSSTPVCEGGGVRVVMRSN